MTFTYYTYNYGHVYNQSGSTVFMRRVERSIDKDIAVLINSSEEMTEVQLRQMSNKMATSRRVSARNRAYFLSQRS